MVEKKWALLSKQLPTRTHKAVEMDLPTIGNQLDDLVRELSWNDKDPTKERIEQIKFDARKAMKAYIEFELVKLSALTSVNGNLTSVQVEYIADRIIDEYPHETIADVKLCFEYGAGGRYGDIFRLDPILILGKWWPTYVDEKYDLIEQKQKKERAEQEKRVLNFPPPGAVDDEKAKEHLKNWLASVERIDKKLDEKIVKPEKRTPYINNIDPLWYQIRQAIIRQTYLYYEKRHGVDVSKFHHWPVEKHGVFALTASDARAIYDKSIKSLK